VSVSLKEACRAIVRREEPLTGRGAGARLVGEGLPGEAAGGRLEDEDFAGEGAGRVGAGLLA
jgi:hypothetical protein